VGIEIGQYLTSKSPSAWSPRFIMGQLYVYLLLRLPSFYLYRLARVFQDLEMSEPEIRRMAVAKAEEWKKNEKDHGGRRRSHRSPGSMPMTLLQFGQSGGWPTQAAMNESSVSPALMRFKDSWESFIDSMLREWKTLNVVTALMLSYVRLCFI
jgi:hypothetical protein